MTNFENYKYSLNVENFQNCFDRESNILNCIECPARKDCEFRNNYKSTCWDCFKEWANTEVE
jgi:hypothetical protein